MRLKHHRELAGLSQRKIAEIMEVSQPTVTRWETGQAEMSGQRLRRAAPRYIEAPADWDQNTACWGTLKFDVSGRSFAYPISFAQRSKLADTASEYDQSSPWVEILTLNNTVLVINLNLIDGIDLTSVDVDSAPFHMTSEAYAALKMVPQELPEHLIEEITEFRADHGEEEPLITSEIRVHYGSGKELRRELDITAANAVSLLLRDLGEPLFFELPESNGYLSHILSLNRVAAIEVPLAKFQMLIEEVDHD